MAPFEVDREIWALFPFSLGAAANLELIESDVLGFVDLADPIATVSGVDITWAVLIALAALGYIVINRDESFRSQIQGLAAVEAWMVYATVALVIAPPLFPAFADTLGNTLAGWIAFLVQGAGFVLISYAN